LIAAACVTVGDGTVTAPAAQKDGTLPPALMQKIQVLVKTDFLEADIQIPMVLKGV